MRIGISAAVVALALALAACSGSGSSGGPSGPGGGASCQYGYKPLACWTYGDNGGVLAARVPIALTSCSYSYEGQALARSWALEQVPATSTAATLTASGSTAALVADVAGDYTVAITVTDGCGTSTSRYAITPLEFSPWANAGSSQVVALTDPAPEVPLDGTGSTDLNQDPLTYAWTITAAPAGSAAALVGAGTATPRLVPDLPGTYEITLAVTDGRSTPDTSAVRIDAYHPALKVAVQPWDVEYSAALDLLVALEDGGSSLWIVNPHDGATTEVPLTAVAYAVSVSADGLHAGVSHSGMVSWVDLATRTVELEISTASDGGDAVLPAAGQGAGYAFLFPRVSATLGVQAVKLDGTLDRGFRAGAPAESSPAKKPRADSAGVYLYAIGADDEFDRYYFTYYQGLNYDGGTQDYRTKGNGPWLSPDGARVYVGSGDVYLASALSTRLSGSLKLPGDASGLRWIADSATGGLLVVPENGTTFRLHDRTTLAVVREEGRPVVFLGGGSTETGAPVFAFWKADGSGFYVVTKLWSGVHAMGVAEY